MLESSSSMRRCNDQIRAIFVSASANLVANVANLQRRLDFDPIPIGFSHEIVHLFPRIIFGLLHQERKIVSRVFIACEVILDMDRMKKDKRRVELSGQCFGVIDTLH